MGVNMSKNYLNRSNAEYDPIGDPFGGSLKVYEATRDEMVEAIPSLIEFLKTQLNASR